MRNSPDSRPATSAQPRFTAFLVMIGGLLLVFVAINRIDRIVEHFSQAGSPAAVAAPGGLSDAKDRHRRVEIIIGTEKSSRKAPQNTSAGNLQQGRSAAEPRETMGRNQDGAPPLDKVVLPRKPAKGSKLSLDTFALKDSVPAEKNSVMPSDSARMKTVYRATDHLAKSRRHRPARKKRYHILTETDTLWSIAVREYGGGKYYTAILEANPGLRPDALPAGKRIVLPDLDAAD